MQIARRQIGIQIGWNGQNSAAQNLKAQRARLGKYLGGTQSAMSALGSSLISAQNNKISGMANLSAQQAVNRIKAQISAAIASRDRQLADAQATLAATQSNYNSSALAAAQTSTGNVLNTSA
jgi:hypothetical protein